MLNASKNLALESYCYNHDIPFPYQGVPQLEIYIPIISVIITFITLSIVVLTYVVLRSIGRYYQLKSNHFFYRPSVKFTMFFLAYFSSLSIAAFVFFRTSDLIPLTSTVVVGTFIVILLPTIILTFMTKWIAKQSNGYHTFFSLAFTLIVLVLTCISFPFSGKMPVLLKKLRCGGGIYQSVTFENSEGIVSTMKGETLLKSREFIYLKEEKSGLIEIPLVKVSQIATLSDHTRN